jgi:hypothetical protein
MKEGLCTVVTDREEEDPLDPSIIRRMECLWDYRCERKEGGRKGI